jgi:hypothetical protein
VGPGRAGPTLSLRDSIAVAAHQIEIALKVIRKLEGG